MTSPTVAGNSSRRLRQTVSYGTLTAGGAQAHAKSSAVILFHRARHTDNEPSALGVAHTQFGCRSVKRGDSLLNFAEGILVGAGLALMASEDLLSRSLHLLASLQKENATDAEQLNAETVRESSRDVFV